jgi:NAD(P)H-hydrate epimerase
MKPVLTPAEMKAADQRAIASGTPETVLVERAGAAVARHAVRTLGGTYGRRVVVVCGKGNNGADGLVAARLLRARGVGIEVVSLGSHPLVADLVRVLTRADLVIDAMYGTGFRGSLDGDAAIIARALDDHAVLAVDIPSGIDGTTGEARGVAVRARETITFAALKPGLLFEPGRSHAGIVRIADIGIDPGHAAAQVLDAPDLTIANRAPDAHKWSTAVLVIGGSTGMIGAPLMAARAAARCGAGMVVCGLPGADAAARASDAEIVTRALSATPEGALDTDAARVMLKDVERFHAVIIGPGLGRDDRTQTAVRRMVAECPVPLVVDADALNALAVDLAPCGVRHAAGLSPMVITPHAGEFARLAGEAVGPDRIASARKLAARTHAVVVLKGPGTVIAAPDGAVVINRTDGPALASAGTGDVLSGVIGGLIATGAAPFAAAATGTYVHGRAASAAGTGSELIATDLIAALAPTLESLRSGTDPWEE